MDEYIERLLEADGVRFETELRAVDADELGVVESRSRLRGGVAVAVTNDAGKLLLVRNGWMDGYGFPGGGVEPDEEWEDAAVREVEEKTGIEIELGRSWLVPQGEYEHEGERYDGEYTVFYHATAADDGTVGDELGIEGETIEDAAWFDAMPDEAFQPDRISDVLDESES
ncbi:NUDIX hydrolase [Haladaptatus sp.]|uniref:NUDIX hydrolase n=1 Tax=Haladaptatus sp. TaxID=1973141 RepID=UPI003C4E90F2